MSYEAQKMSDNVSFDSDLKLIKAVQKRPYLYDKSTFAVSNNESFIANAWSKISKEVKLPQEDCVKQWKYLRNRYTRSPHSSWDLAPYLSFLEPFINRRPKKDKSDLPTNGTSVASNVKQTGNQSKGVPVLPKPPAPSKVQKKKEKLADPVIKPQLASSSSLLEIQSNHKFCESLSNDLQTLTGEQQMKCRIDILQLIDKYKNSTGNKKKPKADVENEKSNVVSNVSKKFAAIVDKISKGSMTSYDQDWLLIFAAKNFFCQLMDVRKANVELDRMLPTFENAEKPRNFEQPSAVETQNNPMDFVAPENFVRDSQEQFYADDPYASEDGDMEEPTVKTEPQYYEDPDSFDVKDASVFAREIRERENETHDTLKNLYLSEGMMKIDRNRFLCLLCDDFCGTNFYSSHTQSAVHQAVMKEYLVKCQNVKDTALPQLNSGIYCYQLGGLYCIKCDVPMSNRKKFLTHLKSLKHKNQLQTLPFSCNQDMYGEKDVGQGIVQVNSSNFCVLCDVKVIEHPSILHAASPNHKKAIAVLKGVFKMSPNHGYCSHCNDMFLLPTLEDHINYEKHVLRVMKELDNMP